MKKQKKIPKSERVRRDHDNVRRLYKELINSHRLGSSFSRGRIYEDLADKTGYSERQVQRILTEY